MPQRFPETPAMAAYAKTETNFFAHHGFWAPGVRVFRQLRFSAKAVLISLFCILPMLCIIGWLLLSQYQQARQERMEATRQHVEVAYSVLQYAYSLETSGKMDHASAQQLAINVVKQLRYDDNNYFWINDEQARMVMHPTSAQFDGTDMSSFKDPNGLTMFKAFADTGKNGGKGYIAYQWSKVAGEPPVDKISYVRGFKPWGWVIGTGVYVQDVRDSVFASVRKVALGVLLIVTIVGYLFLSFYRVIDGGLKETRRHLHAITAGDLTTSPTPWGKDEAAHLMLDLLSMQNALRTMVRHVRKSSEEILHSAREIASGSQDLSRRTEHAASNLEESAASMEEITSTVSQSAQHTQEAANMARSNASSAAEGGQIMRDVAQTMEGIRSASNKISEIIGSIDGIAFQTNILALNAAVEAARAGEQGRGFAVVATEVRALSQRSAAAAKEIKNLIDESVTQVATGTMIVRKAGTSIDDIVMSSQRVNDLLGEIANGAREQDAGMRQMGQSVNELDQMTQQNAAMVEQTAAAATFMEQQAIQLGEEVSRFSLPPEQKSTELSVNLAEGANFDFNQAIDAHRQWKVKLRTAISKQETLDVNTICRDDCCPLGMWLHGKGGKHWNGQPIFRQLIDKHAQFHKAAGAVAEKINRHLFDDAEKLIGSGSHFANVSSDVSTLLSSAKRALK